jgi:hypothetical protein
MILNPEINTRAQNSCDFIRKIRDYQKSVKLIEHMDDVNKVPEIDAMSFNINVYLSLFNRLKVDSGKICCLIGNYDKTAGWPLLYAKDRYFNESGYISNKLFEANERIDSFISQNILRYKKANFPEERINRMIRTFENLKKGYDTTYALKIYARDPINKLCNNLIPDDSQEGYLQYLFFHEMGEQFALFWHAGCEEKTVLCNRKDVEYFLSYYRKRNSSYDYEENKIVDLLNSDISPVVELGLTNCTISWYEIFTCRGIFKNKYTIERTYPFRVIKVESENIMKVSPQFFF